MANPLKLSVLDQSPAAGDKTQDHAIRESLALAKHCDALGYHRYWVSEHHNSASIVGTAPEVLMAAIAATTQRIRIGSAGVMLPHYSTLKVAEQFRVLEAIAPGRIDIGVGPRARLRPHDGDGAQSRPQCRGELPQPGAGTGLLVARGAVATGAPVPRDSRASRRGPRPRRSGSSAVPTTARSSRRTSGSRMRTRISSPTGRGTEEALSLYRRNFRASALHAQPSATICVWALAADTEAEARHLLMTREHWRVGFEKGLRTPLVSPEAAAAHPYTEAERTIIQSLRERAIVGNADQVAAKLKELSTAFGLDEIVINTWTHDPTARHRSYELIAQAVMKG